MRISGRRRSGCGGVSCGSWGEGAREPRAAHSIRKIVKTFSTGVRSCGARRRASRRIFDREHITWEAWKDRGIHIPSKSRQIQDAVRRCCEGLSPGLHRDFPTVPRRQYHCRRASSTRLRKALKVVPPTAPSRTFPIPHLSISPEAHSMASSETCVGNKWNAL
jgi:hypothetical protein